MARRTDRFTRMAICLCLIGAMACVLRTSDRFRLLPGEPQYLVQSPNLERTPYDEVLQAYTPHGRGWVELKPGMGVFIQNVLFREGSTHNSLEDYLGTESIRYEAGERGTLAEVGQAVRMEPRPQGAPPVDQLISKRQQEQKYHRFFYQVLVHTPEAHRVAALVSSDSLGQLELLTERIQSGATALERVSVDDYTLFPESASAALEMTITVDGAPTHEVWGSKLSRVVPRNSPHPKLFRFYKGAWRRVDFDSGDRVLLSVPLLPGDRIKR
jgi:hypothetical protein